MSAKAYRRVRLAPALLLLASVSACGSFDGATARIASVVTPYKVDVVQGNFVSREQVEALQPGMGRQQVREILGTPLVSSLFHADRWEYVFTLQRPGQPVQSRKLTVFFRGEVLERHEGDEMPSESEFVASLETRKGQRKVPVLEASEEQLAKYPAAPSDAAAQEPGDAPAAPAATPYPPLEARTR
ncbi:MAG: cell envelope protein SmpA [Burkholderiales bacterium 68-12]|nr:MAG: cell envelope protein SmpA [Burkholderiales bacterium 68-12]